MQFIMIYSNVRNKIKKNVLVLFIHFTLQYNFFPEFSNYQSAELEFYYILILKFFIELRFVLKKIYLVIKNQFKKTTSNITFFGTEIIASNE